MPCLERTGPFIQRVGLRSAVSLTSSEKTRCKRSIAPTERRPGRGCSTNLLTEQNSPTRCRALDTRCNDCELFGNTNPSEYARPPIPGKSSCLSRLFVGARTHRATCCASAPLGLICGLCPHPCSDPEAHPRWRRDLGGGAILQRALRADFTCAPQFAHAVVLRWSAATHRPLQTSAANATTCWVEWIEAYGRWSRARAGAD
jgi:hypothetical protein